VRCFSFFFRCCFFCFFDVRPLAHSLVRFLLLLPFVEATDAEGFDEGADWREGMSFIEAVDAEFSAG